MIFDILTIFPDLLQSPLQEGIIRRAREKQQIAVNIVNLRNFTSDRHQMTDDRPFGGGEGMVMKPEPLARATRWCREKNADGSLKVILLSPQGRRYDQRVAKELSEENHLLLVCGRYEGVDERYRERFVEDEISLGDFILTGGELGAMVIIDSVTRLLPGVLGCSDSADKDTFSRNLLKHPQYTRPRTFEGDEVPEELLSGNHKEIEKYRFLKAVEQTLQKRPDIINNEVFSKQELKLLQKANLLEKIKKYKVT